MKCDECGATASGNDLFCGACGAILPVPTAGAEEKPLEAVTTAQQAGKSRLDAPRRDTRANTAYVFGIVSIAMAVIACIPVLSFVSCLGPVAGITAIILGALARRDIHAHGSLEQDRARAQQGLILGVVGLILYFVVFGMSMILGIGLGILGEM